MKQLLSLILLACIPLHAYTQENPAPDFICLYNGRLMLPFLPSKPENKQKVKTVTLLLPYTHTENEVLHYDTSVSYKQWYAPAGAEITLENNPYSEFKGFKNISFNRDGTLASKTFETQGMRGCGNYHWQVGGVAQYHYEYQKGRCVTITAGDSSYTSNTYNDNGLKTATANYYYTIDSGKRQLHTGEYSYQYRYDRKGRLAEEYKINNFRNAKAAGIATLAPGMLQVLLRQTPEFTNDYLISTFGITADSLYVYRADLPETLVKRIDDRDAADFELTERYKEMANYFTGYEYKDNDLPAKRYLLEGDELQQVETFSYDDRNRLIQWDRLCDFYTPNNWDNGNKTVWTFDYNTDNQPIRCERRQYKRSYRSGYSELKEKPDLELDETVSFDFTYNTKGSVITMKLSYKNAYRNDVALYLVAYTFF